MLNETVNPYYLNFNGMANLKKLLDILKVPTEKERYELTIGKPKKQLTGSTEIDCELKYNSNNLCKMNFRSWKNHGLEIKFDPRFDSPPEYFIKKIKNGVADIRG